MYSFKRVFVEIFKDAILVSSIIADTFPLEHCFWPNVRKRYKQSDIKAH